MWFNDGITTSSEDVHKAAAAANEKSIIGL